MRPVRFAVPIAPGLGAVNRRYVGSWSGKGLALSKEYRTFKAAVAFEAAKHAARYGRFDAGALACSLVTFWPTRHADSEPQGFPRGDVDACIKAVLDGLADGGLIDTDARFLEVHARKRYDKDNPRVLVAVWPMVQRGDV